MTKKLSKKSSPSSRYKPLAHDWVLNPNGSSLCKRCQAVRMMWGGIWRHKDPWDPANIADGSEDCNLEMIARVLGD